VKSKEAAHIRSLLLLLLLLLLPRPSPPFVVSPVLSSPIL
jgi:hypothetical protein